MQPIRTIESRTVVLPFTNIDTDQIIPARFLTTTTREGLGKQAFADWRYDATGAAKSDFILNQPEVAGCGDRDQVQADVGDARVVADARVGEGGVAGPEVHVING